MSVLVSALFALASSGRALTEQRPVSERAAKQGEDSVGTLTPNSIKTLYSQVFYMEARVGIECLAEATLKTNKVNGRLPTVGKLKKADIGRNENKMG